MFKSTGPGNRICNPCSNLPEPYTPPVYGVDMTGNISFSRKPYADS